MTTRNFNVKNGLTAGTITLDTATGNATANYFIGNGSALTGITASQITGVTTIANGTTSVSIPVAAGNVIANVGGTANVLVLSTSGANVTGTLTANNHTVAGATSGIVNVAATLGNLGFRSEAATYTDTAVTGTQANAAIHYIAQPTIGGGTNAKTYTNMATLFVANAPAATTNATITNSFAMFVAAGNSFFGGNILGTLANGNSNVRIATANGNVTLTAVGNTTMTITGTGANITGTANISGNANVGNLGTSALVANGNVNVNQTAAQIFTVAATQPPTTDMFVVTNTGQNVATAGINGISVNYTGGAGAIEASAYRSDMTPGTTSGSTWNAFRVAATTAAASGVIFNGMKFDNKTTGAGTSRAFYVGTGYDDILNYNGTSVIYGNGVINGAQVGAASSIVNGTSNVNIPASGGNVNTSVGGTANVLVITTTGANVLGTITANGIITGGNLIANGANGAVFANSHTASGAATGNANIATVTGNLGIRAISSTYTDNSAAASATIANTAIHAFGTPTLAAANTGVISTNAATFLIEGPPTAGTNMTITNGYALHVESGNALFAGNILGTLANGNSNVRIATANGNVTLTAVGNTTMTITGTGANVAGTVTATGVITGTNLIANGTNGTVFANSHTASGAVTGIVNVAATLGNLGFRSEAATYTDAAATGTQTNAAIHYLAQPTIGGGTNAKTYTNIATLFIANAPAATTNATITNSYAMFVGAGNSLFNGNVTANFFIGNGSQLTGITVAAGSSIVNGTSNVSIPASGGNVNISVGGTANVVVVTSTAANVLGDVRAIGAGTNGGVPGTVFGNSFTVVGAVYGNSNVSTIGNSFGFRAIASQYVDNVAPAGTVANVAIHAVGTPTILASNAITATNLSTFYIQAAPSTSTNVTATNSFALFVAAGNSFFGGNILGTLANGNSNVRIATANGNVTLTAVGNTTMTITGTGANITGTANVSGNANVGNLGTATAIITTGNITTINSGLMQNGTSNVVVTASGGNVTLGVAGTTRITATSVGANVTGTLGVSGNANAANIGAAIGVFTTSANTPLVQNGTSNVAIASGANVTIGVAGTTRITATSVGANVTGTLGVSGAATADTFQSSNNGAGTNFKVGDDAWIGDINVADTISIRGVANAANAYIIFGNADTTTKLGRAGSGALTYNGAVNITASTAATSRTTGALIVTGGIGANANSFFTNLNVASNIAYVAPNGANTINSTMLNGGTLAWSGNAGQLFSIADSMTGNIFTVNDVSGIPLISVDAGGNIQFAVSGGFVNYGVTTAITAAGSTQATATTLSRPINVVSTVSASTGVILPTVPAGARIIVMNTSGTALNVYPPSGAAVNSAATNAAYSQPAGVRLEFISVSATQWYTLNATYG